MVSDAFMMKLLVHMWLISAFLVIGSYFIFNSVDCYIRLARLQKKCYLQSVICSILYFRSSYFHQDIHIGNVFLPFATYLTSSGEKNTVYGEAMLKISEHTRPVYAKNKEEKNHDERNKATADEVRVKT